MGLTSTGLSLWQRSESLTPDSGQLHIIPTGQHSDPAHRADGCLWPGMAGSEVQRVQQPRTLLLLPRVMKRIRTAHMEYWGSKSNSLKRQETWGLTAWWDGFDTEDLSLWTLPHYVFVTMIIWQLASSGIETGLSHIPHSCFNIFILLDISPSAVFNINSL